jgi:hypothetical protein
MEWLADVHEMMHRDGRRPQFGDVAALLEYIDSIAGSPLP